MMRTDCFNRKLYLLVAIFCISNWIGYVYSKDLPPFMKNLKCHLEELDTCLVKNGNEAIPILAKGIPDYGIPNMNPLLVPFINLVTTESLSLNLTNVEVYGLDKLKLIDFKYDKEKNGFITSLKGDNLTAVGNYDANGKISVMAVRGKGRFTLYFKNGKYKSSIYTVFVERKGEKYMKRVDSRLQTRFGRLIFKLDNLFEGNKQLGEEVNAFLNENWETLVTDFGPPVEKAVAKIIDGIFDNFTHDIPLKNIFL